MLRKENSKLNEVGFGLASCVGVHAIFLAHERGWERLRECPTTVDLSTRLWKITTQFVGFIPRSLVLRSIIAELSIYLNWAIFVSKTWSLKSNLLCFLCPIRSLEIIQKLEHSFAVSNIFFNLHVCLLSLFQQLKQLKDVFAADSPSPLSKKKARIDSEFSVHRLFTSVVYWVVSELVYDTC